MSLRLAARSSPASCSRPAATPGTRSAWATSWRRDSRKRQFGGLLAGAAGDRGDAGRLLQPPATSRPATGSGSGSGTVVDPGRRRLGGDPLAGRAASPPASTGGSTRRRRDHRLRDPPAGDGGGGDPGPADRRRQRQHPRRRRRLHRGRCSASPPSRRWAGSSPASSCRAPGPSGSANGCAWSAAPWPARSRAPSPRSASSTRP